MKIMAPLSPNFSIPDLIQAGADGFYLGYISKDWLKAFGNGFFINRRGHVSDANFLDSTIEKAIDCCHSLNATVYCTFNNHQYTKSELNLIYQSILSLHYKHIDGIIASDINILSFCKQMGIQTILSTCATNYNHYSCELYKLFGVSRIILPRDITIKEMGIIIDKVPGLEWEAFVYHSACRFSESVCLSNHGLYGSICKRFRNLPQIAITEGIPRRITDCYQGNSKGYCGLCEIYNMKQIGISWLKIVERSLPGEIIINTCNKVKFAVELCEQVISDNAFRQVIQQNESCIKGKMCYYNL